MYIRSLCVYKDIVVVGRDAPVLAMVILLRVVFLVVREEGVELKTLLEVLDGLEASDVLGEVEVAVSVYASSDQPVPVDALQFHVCVVLLERKVERLTEVNVWPLDSVHVFAGHLELVEVEVLWEHLHT